MRCNVIKVRNSKIDWSKAKTAPKKPRSYMLISLLILASILIYLYNFILLGLWLVLVLDLLFSSLIIYLLSYLDSLSKKYIKVYCDSLAQYKKLLALRLRIESSLDIDIEYNDLHTASLLAFHGDLIKQCNYPLFSLSTCSPKHILSRFSHIIQKTKEVSLISFPIFQLIKLFKLLRLFNSGINSQMSILKEYSSFPEYIIEKVRLEELTSLEKFRRETAILYNLLKRSVSHEAIDTSFQNLQMFYSLCIKPLPHKQFEENSFNEMDEDDNKTEEVQEHAQESKREEDDICWILEGHGGNQRPQLNHSRPHFNPEKKLISATLQELKQSLKPLKAKTLYKAIDKSGKFQTSEHSLVQDIAPEKKPNYTRARPSMNFLAELKQKAKAQDSEVLES